MAMNKRVGKELNLRTIHPTDAEAFIDLLSSIESDSPFALLEPGERRTTLQEQWDEITGILAQENQVIFVVEDRDVLVGWLGAFGERYRRVRHSVLIGIGIRTGYRGTGIGTSLFEALEKWAWDHQIRRLELLVQTGNEAGITLYRKMGFQIEGTKRDAYLLDGKFVDEYLMAKILIPQTKPPKPLYPRW